MPRLPHKPPSAATKIGGIITGSPSRTSRRLISLPGRVSNYKKPKADKKKITVPSSSVSSALAKPKVGPGGSEGKK